MVVVTKCLQVLFVVAIPVVCGGFHKLLVSHFLMLTNHSTPLSDYAVRAELSASKQACLRVVQAGGSITQELVAHWRGG